MSQADHLKLSDEVSETENRIGMTIKDLKFDMTSNKFQHSLASDKIYKNLKCCYLVALECSIFLHVHVR